MNWKWKDPITRQRERILEDGLNRRTTPPPFPLPRGLGDRILLGVMSIPILLASAAVLFAPRGDDGESNGLVAFLAIETAFILFAFSGLCLLWAIATPRFIERLLVRYAFQAMLLALTSILALMIWMLYAGLAY